MRFKKLGLLCIVAAALLLNGYLVSTSIAAEEMGKPSPHVQDLIDKHKLTIVDFDYVLKAVGNGTRNGASALLVDARPAKKYEAATIPSSINIPDTQIEKYIGQLDGCCQG